MPKIKAFRGIRPGAAYAGQVVLDIENLSIDEAKIIRQENPYSYVNMLVPKLDNFFLMGSKNELVYKKINENFEEFIDKGVLITDPEPSLYIYQTTRGKLVQTGIWTVTSIDDYLNNVVKKHELTRADREQSLINYLQQTGIDANPVLITYLAVPEIDEIISKVCRKEPELFFVKQDAEHRLWKIDTEADVSNLVNAFAKLPVSYIADGHHRAAAASLLGIERRKLNLKHKGDEEYNFFASVYMSADQLKIYEFNRLLKDLNGLSASQFIDALSQHFTIEKSREGEAVIPRELHHFGMYLDGSWYRLVARQETLKNQHPVAQLDVSVLQDFVLSPILNISDPRTDPRLCVVGGLQPVKELVKQVDKGDFALAFTLFPTSIDQLISVADAGEVMPPKSTLFEPKFQVGLVIHKIN